MPRLDHRDLVERLSDIVYALDLDGRFTYVNAAGLKLFGREWNELAGQHFGIVLAPESLDAALAYFARGLQAPESRPYFELRIRRPDGQVIDMEVHAGSLYCDGVLVGRQGVGRDISELKRLQAEIDAKPKRLELVEDQHRIAHDLYRRIGAMTEQAPLDPERVDRLLRRVQGSLVTEAAKSAGLSENDLRIVELVSDGFSNREIAEAVHLSPNTVKDHVSRIIAALGAHSRAGVGVAAARLGLLGSSRRMQGSDGRRGTP